MVLPGKHFIVVRFEQANVKTFQLHKMGKEAERYVGVVSLSPPLYRNLATRCLGYIFGDTTHSSCAIWSQSCWGKSAVTFCILSFGIPKCFHIFIIVGLSLHFQYSGHIVKAVSYEYRSPSISCARLKRFWSRRQFREGFPCLPWMQTTFALDA